MEPFADLATRTDATLDALALGIAAELRPVDAQATLAELDSLAGEVREHGGDDIEALQGVLAYRHGFAGDSDEYDHPDNSMLDRVLERRKGLPILLSVVYVEVARRAGIDLRGVGLPGHYVVGHFGHAPPVLLDPFGGGERLHVASQLEVRPWGAQETALRMLNNLVGSYTRRGDLGRAIRAAELRRALPLGPGSAEAMTLELNQLRARLN